MSLNRIVELRVKRDIKESAPAARQSASSSRMATTTAVELPVVDFTNLVQLSPRVRRARELHDMRDKRALLDLCCFFTVMLSFFLLWIKFVGRGGDYPRKICWGRGHPCRIDSHNCIAATYTEDIKDVQPSIKHGANRSQGGREAGQFLRPLSNRASP